ncbi:MAG: ion transporter [Leifsonia sp.]
MAAKARTELKNISYEIFIGILSILSIVNLVLVYTIDDESLQTVLAIMNGLFSAIFLGDFIYRIRTAPSRSAYFFKHFGWADLLASLPFPQFKVLRIFRLIRVFRLLRKTGVHSIGRTLIRDRANSALLVLLLMGILVLQFGSLTMLFIEEDAPGANITSASDAVWFTIVTISTVGYGDQYPVTNLGRLLGAGIIVVGVGIFGTFTGYLANVFLSPKQDAEATGPHTGVEVSAGAADDSAPGERASDSTTGAPVPAATMDELRALLAESEAKLAEMRLILNGPPGSDRPAR